MYSQFCAYLRRDAQKYCATIHIPRKSGEQIEFDWAGAPAHITDPNTSEITEYWLFVRVLTQKNIFSLRFWHESLQTVFELIHPNISP